MAGEQRRGVGVGNAVGDRGDPDMGIARGNEGGGERGLALGDVVGPVERLALEIAEVDRIAVDDRQPAHPGAGQCGNGSGANPAGTDHDDVGGLQPLLPNPADLRQDDVARIAIEFVVGEIIQNRSP